VIVIGVSRGERVAMAKHEVSLGEYDKSTDKEFLERF
jgi:hypothetical protein